MFAFCCGVITLDPIQIQSAPVLLFFAESEFSASYQYPIASQVWRLKMISMVWE